MVSNMHSNGNLGHCISVPQSLLSLRHVVKLPLSHFTSTGLLHNLLIYEREQHIMTPSSHL